jgi:hypothetical protein
VQEIPAFYVTRSFITALTTAHFLSLSWARSIQALHPISWFILILLSICSRVFLMVSLPEFSQPKSSMHFSFSPYVLHGHPSHSSWFVHPNKSRSRRIQVIELLILKSPPVSCVCRSHLDPYIYTYICII